VNEAALKRKLVDAIKVEMPGAVIFRHEDRFTAGIPDLSVTYSDRTVWIEVKYSRPGKRAKISGAQRLILSRLMKHGRVLLLTYDDQDGSQAGKVTNMDVPMRMLGVAGVGDDMLQNERVGGFDHKWAASIIKRELTR